MLEPEVEKVVVLPEGAAPRLSSLGKMQRIRVDEIIVVTRTFNFSFFPSGEGSWATFTCFETLCNFVLECLLYFYSPP